MTPASLFALSGKTAVVTGGATGIGRMASEALVCAGARVLIASRKGDVCEAAAAQLNDSAYPGTAEGFAGDVSTEAGVAALAAEVASGQVDVETPMGPIALKIPEGSNSGATLRLRGKGVQISGKPGHLYARLEIVIQDPKDPKLRIGPGGTDQD